jgi:NAD(P)H-flavin reductase
MVSDVAAEVIANRRLTSDFNVLSLAAPEIARGAAPGQFVMVKASPGLDPLLRRPFSIFEILRDGGRVVGLSLLNKRVGVGTRLLFDKRPGDVVDCLGPLGQPFVPVDPPEEAWMVAGGVGLAPFATLAEALAARRTPMTLFYGGRSAVDLFNESFFEALGASLVLTTEDGTRGERGRAGDALCLRPHADDARGGGIGRAVRPPRLRVPRARDGLRHGRLLQLRCPRPPRRQQPLRQVVSRRAGLRRIRGCLGRVGGTLIWPTFLSRSGR